MLPSAPVTPLLRHLRRSRRKCGAGKGSFRAPADIRAPPFGPADPFAFDRASSGASASPSAPAECSGAPDASLPSLPPLLSTASPGDKRAAELLELLLVRPNNPHFRPHSRALAQSGGIS